MQFRFLISFFLLLTLVLLPVTAIKAAEITQGVMLSNSCAGCHGTDGKSPGSIPSLYGKSAQFIIEALQNFRSGRQPSTVMGRHAKGYSDMEIRLIAEHFASLK